MKFHSAVSELPDTLAAADALLAGAGAAVPSPDLACVFFTAHHLDEAEALLRRVHDSLSPDCLVS